MPRPPVAALRSPRVRSWPARAFPAPFGPLALSWASFPLLRLWCRRPAPKRAFRAGFVAGLALHRRRLRLGAPSRVRAAAWRSPLATRSACRCWPPDSVALRRSRRCARRRRRASRSPPRPASGWPSSSRARRSGCSPCPWNHLGYALARLAVRSHRARHGSASTGSPLWIVAVERGPRGVCRDLGSPRARPASPSCSRCRSHPARACSPLRPRAADTAARRRGAAPSTSASAPIRRASTRTSAALLDLTRARALASRPTSSYGPSRRTSARSARRGRRVPRRRSRTISARRS